MGGVGPDTMQEIVVSSDAQVEKGLEVSFGVGDLYVVFEGEL